MPSFMGSPGTAPYVVFQLRVVRGKAEFAAARPTVIMAEGARACGLRPVTDYTQLENVPTKTETR